MIAKGILAVSVFAILLLCVAYPSQVPGELSLAEQVLISACDSDDDACECVDEDDNSDKHELIAWQGRQATHDQTVPVLRDALALPACYLPQLWREQGLHSRGPPAA